MILRLVCTLGLTLATALFATGAMAQFTGPGSSRVERAPLPDTPGVPRAGSPGTIPGDPDDDDPDALDDPDDEPLPNQSTGPSPRPYESGRLDEPSYGRRPLFPLSPFNVPAPMRPAEIQPGDAVGPRGIYTDPMRPASRNPGDVPAGQDPSFTRPPMNLAPGQRPSVASLPPEDQPEEGTPQELPANLKRQLVEYSTREPAGTLIIDTANTHLYLVLGGGKAMRYGIGVGRDGFTWTGRERISRMSEWPEWYPPSDMIERQPYLPRMMAGGPGNPLGARALYLGKTLYRIHGTNQPSTIGKFVSSGCVRMLNDDVEDLYQRVTVGSQVVVLAGSPPVTGSISR